MPVFATGIAAITAVGAEVAGVSPPPLEPVTTTRSVEPTSSGDTSCVGFVAPGMSAQPAPAALQRRHW